MKAILRTRYGGPEVLSLQDLPVPTPAPDQVLVKVHAAALNVADWRVLKADPWVMRLGLGLFKPKPAFQVVGADFAGTVVAIGAHVTDFTPGDTVLGDTSHGCWGACAEYVIADAAIIARAPDRAPLDVLASIPMAGVTALQVLRDHGGLKQGHRLLINGASGGVGTFAIQLGTLLGAEVTGVCSTSKVALARDLGCDHVIDYTQDDFTQTERRFDVILDLVGNVSTWKHRKLLAPGGVYLMSNGRMARVFETAFLGWLGTRGRRLKLATVKPSAVDLAYLGDLVRSGRLRPIIDRRYPLSQTSEAMAYMLEGHARGKVVIDVGAAAEEVAADAA